jgi:signal transduction histidine kinase
MVDLSVSTSEPVLSLKERRRFYSTALGARVALATAFLVVMLVFGITEAMPSSNSNANVVILACLALVNGAYWAIGSRRGFPIEDFAIHEAIDVVVLTLVIHYAGGIQAPYCALAYLSLVLFAAVGESRRIAVRLALFSIVCLLSLVALEESGLVHSYAEIWGYRLPVAAQIFGLLVSGVFLLSVAWVAGTLANELKRTNVSLAEATVRLQEQNRDLERRVEERTARLARATQEIEDLVHIVSHDLKNVAVAVTETARKLVARESSNLSVRGRSYADNLLEDGRTMSRMLEDLLLLFRHTEGAGTRGEWVDVDGVVRQALRQLQYQIEAKRIEVAVGPLPSVFAETQKMRHIFDNLLNNACKYVGDKKPARIEVAGSANGSSVKYFVRDNGVGLDERQRARIFQLYHRSPVQEVEGVVQEGHGVGLAIVKRIVERYGGSIVVESVPREGTTFEVTLPRGDEPRS